MKNPRRYIDEDELTDGLLAVREAEKVPAARFLLDAADRRSQELVAQAIETAGTVSPREIEILLIEAKGLRWIVNFPKNVRDKINQEQ